MAIFMLLAGSAMIVASIGVWMIAHNIPLAASDLCVWRMLYPQKPYHTTLRFF